jgi:hypothetical protein
MVPITEMKKEYLALHDYQTGGVWFVFNARSENEITDRFSFLTVLNQRPDWMTEAAFAEIKKSGFQDIDEPAIPVLREMAELQ